MEKAAQLFLLASFLISYRGRMGFKSHLPSVFCASPLCLHAFSPTTASSSHIRVCIIEDLKHPHAAVCLYVPCDWPAARPGCTPPFVHRPPPQHRMRTSGSENGSMAVLHVHYVILWCTIFPILSDPVFNRVAWAHLRQLRIPRHNLRIDFCIQQEGLCKDPKGCVCVGEGGWG